MVYHANHLWLSGGFLGVEVFFVISGYLITLLMVGEHERKEKVSLRKFWLRRARRLLPALFVLLCGLAIYLALFDRRPQGQSRGDFIGALTYGSNWYQIVVGQGYTAAESLAPLRHLWSLAVEEQFYLLWPLVMVLILRHGRAYLPKVGVWLAGISVAITVAMGVLFAGGDVATTCAPGSMNGFWRIAGRCINVNEALYLGTFTRVGGVLLGAAFAMLWRPLAVMRGPLRKRAHRLDLLALVALGGLWLLVSRLYLSTEGRDLGVRYDPWLFRGGFFLTGLATLVLIAAVTHRRTLASRLIGNRVFRWIGARSYGLYLYHWVIYEIIRKEAGIGLTVRQFALAMAISVVVAEASYRLVETPIRNGRLGEWLRGDRRAQTKRVYNRRRWLVALSAVAAAFAGFAGVSIATADNVCVGALACSLQNAGGTVPDVVPVAQGGSSAVASSAVTTTTTSTTVPPPDSTTTAAPAADSTTTVAGAPVDPTASTTTVDPNAATSVANGDSTTTVAVDAATSTTQPPATVPPTTAASAPTRTDPPGSPPPLAVGESVMQGAIPQLSAGGVVVNADKSRQGTEIAAILAQYRAAGQIGPTVVIQSGTNGSVSDATYDQIMASVPANLTPNVYFLTVRAPRGWIADNNARIWNLATRYPNVHIIDWASMSTANDVKLCSDGFHIACSPASEQFYANMIFDAIGRPDLRK
ncbi:MAG: putative acyltransferase [Ilumatobacteraceae bacterium]|nr:putative acyltransferase [Ilumatobacteraceae bacterium]